MEQEVLFNIKNYGVTICPICKKEFKKNTPNQICCRKTIDCNKEADKLIQKKHSSKPRRKEYVRNHKLKSQYGITLEKFLSIRKNQNNICPICNENFSTMIDRDICIDHNHRTKNIRGVICRQCNILIGVIETKKIQIKHLLNAIQYLNKYTKEEDNVFNRN